MNPDTRGFPESVCEWMGLEHALGALTSEGVRLSRAPEHAGKYSSARLGRIPWAHARQECLSRFRTWKRPHCHGVCGPRAVASGSCSRWRGAPSVRRRSFRLGPHSSWFPAAAARSVLASLPAAVLLSLRRSSGDPALPVPAGGVLVTPRFISAPSPLPPHPSLQPGFGGDSPSGDTGPRPPQTRSP